MSIEDHEFQDSDVMQARLLTGAIDVLINAGTLSELDEPYIQFDRDDIIAMAKAIELTGEDLE